METIPPQTPAPTTPAIPPPVTTPPQPDVPKTKKGLKIIIILAVIFVLILIGLLAFLLLQTPSSPISAGPITTPAQTPETTQNGGVQPQQEFENPFEEDTQYVNPFEETQNPFDQI